MMLQIVDNMYDLWIAGERDMLDPENQYMLRNTGQGLQRVQVIGSRCSLDASWLGGSGG